ncbi:CcoQ/FixQ family Cbb3-type cytochrome c oxidase assembly chaperone [Pelovirga terrestris]|uniref:CcoQ/FixQ family Cbb3-type cytochrome c oxidase assembly chaperone n=1 Tax=Pelovirga terrestris TaxID=2771352 RepID=A0A8J6QXA5_9BACT|nr:CcoQ/FixQ family Cbb3-type cytochrome c oxidase assembly chaperone [Pelovirga terrestris]MBD1400638.1 CcoQ/FixQ family Cbb3-type cytochrome c oxidase assembly chaperone [Pelovirga terrestris]
MDLASIMYLAVTFGLFVIFALIVGNTYKRKNKQKKEAPKYRMMDDD